MMLTSTFKARLLTLLTCSAILAGPADANGQCAMGPVKVTTKKAGACRLDKHSARVEDTRCPVEVRGVELTCGRVKLGSWQRLNLKALKICRENQRQDDPGDLYLTQVLRLVSKRKGMVSVDQEERHLTRGAHIESPTRRRTLGTRSGKEVTLNQLFPRQGKKLLASARGRFDSLNEGSKFTWDPRAFAITVKGRETRIEFACPHRVKASQGETLKFTVIAKKRPGRPPRK